jgi:hypothetical protein
MPRAERAPKEEGEYSDTDTEYQKWQEAGTVEQEQSHPSPAAPPEERKRPVHKDRRVCKRSELGFYRHADHTWLTKTPFYIRLGQRPAMLHYIIDQHWDAQELLWNPRK